MSESKLNLFSFSGKTRILHLSWFAFFLTFFMWFNHAPLIASIREAFDLTDQQVKMLLILNVALTIPARIIIGMLASGYAFMNLVARPSGGLLSDRFGRRKTMMILLVGLTAGYLLMGFIDSCCPSLFTTWRTRILLLLPGMPSH